jgi:hypothetical protein
MNAVYNTLFNQFLTQRAEGDTLEANKIYNVLEAIRGWYFVDGELEFKDTTTVTNMVEGTDNSLANYKVYTLEYIKLIRNILASVTATRLIDPVTGNVSRYSSQNEIVQFNISSSDISITTTHTTTNG